MRQTLRNSALAIATVATAAAVAAFPAPGPAGAAGTTTVQIPDRACSAPGAGQMSCYAIRLVTERVTTTQAAQLQADGAARPASLSATAFGPNGGYTPAQIAKAYGFSPGAATTQTVAIVDAYADPSVLDDLNAFDASYGLPAETSNSFKVVNQTGGTDLSGVASDVGWASEITLDVQAVRGLCHHCKILLVEANTNNNPDLSAAVLYASQHAKIVSNSYGGPEGGSADPNYNRPGVAILASTGDDGWYGWDKVNIGQSSDDAPSDPASYPTVIGVGGTSLYLNPDNTRASETVWNDNGPDDVAGYSIGKYFNQAAGAAGSGCSTLYTPKRWQQKVAGYGSLGCNGMRNGVDIAAVADYFTGYDVYQTTASWCPNGGTDGNGTNCPTADPGWQTFGGTSLASPVVGALWALAGGPGGVTYPALSLYGHFKSDKTHPTYDVTVGGTGACDNASPQSCANFFGVPNPNTAGAGLLDCVWGASGTATLANHYQCDAAPGYDGVSGVGAPVGLNVFKPMSPTAVITTTLPVTHGVSHSFSGANSTDPFPGGAISSYAWNWGDGHTSTGKTASHTYSSAGTRTITLTVTDNYGRKGSKKLTITVK